MLRRFRSLAAVQIGIAVLAMGVLVSAPPASGTMLIVPLGAASDSAPRFAGAHDLAILGRGPVTGSLVVFGDGVRLARLGLGEGLLIVQAPGSLCKGTNRDRS